MRVMNSEISDNHVFSNQAISLDNYRTINKTSPIPTVSGRYGFIDSRAVAEASIHEGWSPRSVSERRVRTIERIGYQPHVIRFSSMNLPAVKGDQVPEIIFFNSHDAMATARISFGVFSMICTNKMVVCTAQIAEYIIRHNLHAREIAQEAIHNMMNHAPQIGDRIRELTARQMNHEEQLDYASQTLPVKFNDAFLASHEINIEKLIKPVRPADNPGNLYGLFNIIQEKYIKGGVIIQKRPAPVTNAPAGDMIIEAEFEPVGASYKPEKVKGPRSSRKLTSVTEDLRINKELWLTAEEYLTTN